LHQSSFNPYFLIQIYLFFTLHFSGTIIIFLSFFPYGGRPSSAHKKSSLKQTLLFASKDVSQFYLYISDVHKGERLIFVALIHKQLLRSAVEFLFILHPKVAL
jgi:hypothetical protein